VKLVAKDPLAGGRLESTGRVAMQVAFRGCQAASLKTWHNKLNADHELALAA